MTILQRWTMQHYLKSPKQWRTFFRRQEQERTQREEARLETIERWEADVQTKLPSNGKILSV